MTRITSIEEMLRFFRPLSMESVGKEGSFFHVRESGHGVYVVLADFQCNKDTIAYVKFKQRCLGMAFEDNGKTCRVFGSPASFFLKIRQGNRIACRLILLQENFFAENKIKLYDSFWRDMSKYFKGSDFYAPELSAVFKEAESEPADSYGDPDGQLTACGLAAAVYLMEKVKHHKLSGPVELDEFENHAVTIAKEMIQQDLQNVPTISELCKHTGVNKNKLQAGFRITTGESIGEYVRTVRMARALDLMEDGELSINEISYRVGYFGVSSFYQAFRQMFGETPMTIRTMLKEQNI